MSDAQIWAVILGGAVVTYASRLSFIGWLPTNRLPSWLRLALRFVPTAVLAALVAPELLRPAGTLAVHLGNDRLLAGLVACLVAWRLRNTWLTLGAGMLAYLLLLRI